MHQPIKHLRALAIYYLLYDYSNHKENTIHLLLWWLETNNPPYKQANYTILKSKYVDIKKILKSISLIQITKVSKWDLALGDLSLGLLTEEYINVTPILSTFLGLSIGSIITCNTRNKEHMYLWHVFFNNTKQIRGAAYDMNPIQLERRWGGSRNGEMLPSWKKNTPNCFSHFQFYYNINILFI